MGDKPQENTGDKPPEKTKESPGESLYKELKQLCEENPEDLDKRMLTSDEAKALRTYINTLQSPLSDIDRYLVKQEVKLKLRDAKEQPEKLSPEEQAARAAARPVSKVDLGKEIVKREVLVLMGKGLVSLSKEEGAEVLSEQVGPMLNIVKGERVGTLLQMKDRGAAVQFLQPKMEKNEYPSEENINAILFINRFFTVRKEQLEQMLKRVGSKQSLEEITVEQLLKELRPMTRFIGRISSAFREMKKKGFRSVEELDAVIQTAITPHSEEIHEVGEGSKTPSRLLEQEFNMTGPDQELFLKFVSTARAGGTEMKFLKGFDSGAFDKSREAAKVPQFKEVIRDMHKYLTENTHYIALYTHGANRMGGDSFSSVLTKYIDEKLTIADVVDLYFLLHAAEPKSEVKSSLPKDLNTASSNGAFMVQMKVLSMIKAQDRKYGHAFEGFLARLAEDKSLQVNLPIGIKDGISQAAALARDVGLSVGVDVITYGAKKHVEAAVDAADASATRLANYWGVEEWVVWTIGGGIPAGIAALFVLRTAVGWRERSAEIRLEVEAARTAKGDKYADAFKNKYSIFRRVGKSMPLYLPNIIARWFSGTDLNTCSELEIKHRLAENAAGRKFTSPEHNALDAAIESKGDFNQRSKILTDAGLAEPEANRVLQNETHFGKEIADQAKAEAEKSQKRFEEFRGKSPAEISEGLKKAGITDPAEIGRALKDLKLSNPQLVETVKALKLTPEQMGTVLQEAMSASVSGKPDSSVSRPAPEVKPEPLRPGPELSDVARQARESERARFEKPSEEKTEKDEKTEIKGKGTPEEEAKKAREKLIRKRLK